MSKYRLYACDVRGVVHQDEFAEYDNSTPYYDDYLEFELVDSDDVLREMNSVMSLTCSDNDKLEIIAYLIEVNLLP